MGAVLAAKAAAAAQAAKSMELFCIGSCKRFGISCCDFSEDRLFSTLFDPGFARFC